MLNVSRLRSGYGQGPVKRENEAFLHFGLLGQLDGLQRVQTHRECWCKKGTARIRRSYIKVQGQGQLASQKVT